MYLLTVGRPVNMPVTPHDHWRVKVDDDTVFDVIMCIQMTENECDEEMKKQDEV